MQVIRTLATPWRLWLALGATILLATFWVLQYSSTHFPAWALRADLFRDHTFAEPVHSVTDTVLDPIALARRAGLDPTRPFAVQWDGHAVVETSGRHHLRVAADDGIAVWIDERPIVDRASASGHQELSTAIDLERGLRPLRIRYVQRGGDASLRLRWATPLDRADFQPLLAVPPADPPLVFRRLAKALWFPRLIAAAWSAWLLIGLTLAGLAAVRRWAGPSPFVAPYVLGVTGVLLIATALLFVGLEVGAAPLRGWAPDEITPIDLSHAWQARFSGGWFHKYPPLQFYILSLVTLPFRAGLAWEWFTDDSATQQLVHMVARAVSVTMGLLTLLVLWRIGEETLPRPRALVAAMAFFLTPVVVFYGKTTNVDTPSIFWVALALLFFVRAWKHRTAFDHAGLGLAVAFAVATKDQSYAFFPGVAAALMWRTWHEVETAGSVSGRLRATLLDVRLWTGAGVCAAAYVVVTGVLWNLNGVAAHIQLIVGQGSQPYRMYAPDADGLLRLMVRTLSIAPLTLGALGTALALVGGIRGIIAPAETRYLALLLIPLASYAVTFLAVVGYVYDRFLLAGVLVAGLWAGLGLDWLTARLKSGRVRTIAGAAVLALALVPSAVLDWRMVSDSRLRVEAWMLDTLRDDPLVVGVGTQEHLPNLRPFAHYLVIPSRAVDVLGWNANVIVLNEQWLDRPRLPGAAAVARTLRDAGFVERFSIRPAPRRDLLGALLHGATLIDPFFSNLTKVDPPISVWMRQASTEPSR